MTILLDGGLATELHHRGIAMEAPLFSAQALLTERGREAVLNCHLEFLAAGAEVIPADTFRTNLRAVRESGGDELLAADLTRTAVDIARRAIAMSGADSAALAAMVAPVAECYDPTATPDDDALESEHGFFMGLLSEYGVQIALIETMNSVREAVIATRAACRYGLTPWVSFVCADGGRLLSGEPIAVAAAAVGHVGARAVLVNCTDLTRTREALGALAPCELPIGCYPNVEDRSDAHCAHGAPLPVTLEPEEFAQQLSGLVREYSLAIVGGCCGARPAHIRELAISIGHITKGVLA
ncbi:MAG: enediyne biosynthesis protein CalE2 [Miltoncostaeaceae bacterium]|nr:enediyne biosynthesis protein CalE2 [Miltoncostaeaceae bacterium]